MKKFIKEIFDTLNLTDWTALAGGALTAAALSFPVEGCSLDDYYGKACETYQSYREWDPSGENKRFIYIFDPKTNEERGPFIPKYSFFGDSTLKDSLIPGKRYCFEYNKYYDPRMTLPRVRSITPDTAETK